MASQPMAKIVLKNTTKMSLNERFTAYRAQAQTAATTFRQKIQQATSANRRLAQQMANRPSVIAALRLKKRSLMQRLGNKQISGSNIKSRLNLGARYNNIQNRLGGRGNFNNRRGGFRPGTSPLLKARLGNMMQGNYEMQRQYPRIRFRKRRGSYNRGNRHNVGNFRVPRRPGMQGARGGKFGRGRGRWNNNLVPHLTKQELDNQLDEYMAETKTGMDTNFNQYVTQTY